MSLTITEATRADASAIASVRSAAAANLTEKFGRGHWSSLASERGVARAIEMSRVLVARRRKVIVATLALQTKKPWAIDSAYFTPARRPLYLLNMAVEPTHQHQGIGRRLVEEALALAKAVQSDAMRLDAYDAVAGAGGFYARCGFAEMGRVVYRGVPLLYFELVVSAEK